MSRTMMRTMVRRADAALAALLLAVAAPAIAAAPATPAPVVLPNGVRVIDTVVGTGAAPVPGKRVAVHYTGWLYQDGGKGAKFDSSVDRGQPFVFAPGNGDVIEGWDTGIVGMKVGGKRTLIIPANAGYGDRGAGNIIGPGATLIFEIELVAVEE